MIRIGLKPIEQAVAVANVIEQIMADNYMDGISVYTSKDNYIRINFNMGKDQFDVTKIDGEWICNNWEMQENE